MYKLGKNLELYKEDAKDGTIHFYVIISRKSEKEYLINEVIYTFLTYFKESNSIDNVIAQYITLIKAKKEQVALIKEQLTGFFKSLVLRGWIIDEDNPPQDLIFEPYFELQDKIGDFQIIKLLANNDTTEVYLTKKPNLRKKYVIKVLNANKFTKKDRFENYRTFFKNEYDFIDTFSSIYINKGIKYVDEEDYSYMVLEHINGKSVFRYIRHNKLTTAEKMELVHKMLKGFSIIHKNGIYHGDIHLANVLVTPQARVKVIDFGYSNYVVQNPNEAIRKPRNGGAHAFIPPERTLRSIKRKFSAVEQYQSEVYQIGLIIYYIFMKGLPFKAHTWKTMVDEKRSFKIHEFQPFLERRMPKSVRAIISKSLANDPELRYKDAQDLLKAWKKALK